jgi:hypothetical protein
LEILVTKFKDDESFKSFAETTIRQSLATCFAELLKVHNRIEETVAALKRILPLSAIELKAVSETLKTETGNALHREWQKNARASGRKDRFKDCLAPGDRAQGEKELKTRHTELKIQEPFDKVYQYDAKNGVWQEDILRLDNSQLHPKYSRENNIAAEIAVNLLTEFLTEKNKVTSADMTKWLLKTAGPETHKKWLERNNGWARDSQKKSFDKLPALEAILDFQVLTVIEVLAKQKLGMGMRPS